MRTPLAGFLSLLLREQERMQQYERHRQRRDEPNQHDPAHIQSVRQLGGSDFGSALAVGERPADEQRRKQAADRKQEMGGQGVGKAKNRLL